MKLFTLALFGLLKTTLGAGGSDPNDLVLDRTGLTPGTNCSQEDIQYFYGPGNEAFDADLSACLRGHFFDSERDDRSLCLQGLTTIGQNNTRETIGPLINGRMYSEQCATDCLVPLTICTVAKCQTECIIGGEASLLCRECTVKECTADFYECSGIDPTCELGKDCKVYEPDLVLIIACTAGGLLIFTGLGVKFAMARHRQHLESTRELFAQQLAHAAANAPKVNSVAPDVDIASYEKDNQQKPFMSMFAFQAEHDNEVSLLEEERVTGLNQVDEEWWLVQNSSGAVGLVPAAYLQEVSGDKGTVSISMPADEGVPNF